MTASLRAGIGRGARTLLVACALLALAPIAGAMHPARLEGEVRLAGPLDAKGTPTRGDSHLYVSLTRGAARTLYESLPGDPREDPCTGYRVKGRGNLGCYEIEPAEEYFCSFSLDLDRDRVEAGLGGCF